MRTKTTFAFIIIAIMALCLAASQPAIASDEDDVLQVATNWAKAFNTGDVDLMTSLFWTAPDATRFGPGNAGAFLTKGGGSIIKFWKSTLASTKGAIAISTHHAQATMIGNNVAVLTLYAVSTYTDPTTKEQSIGHVRGTFIVQKINGKWLIVHEHSSNLPTE
jgi:uncharacterized protein (TIGR02246 family)